jgi:hypothetical protein
MSLQSVLGVVQLLHASVESVVDGVMLCPHFGGASLQQTVDGTSQLGRLVSFLLRPGQIVLGELGPRHRESDAAIKCIQFTASDVKLSSIFLNYCGEVFSQFPGPTVLVFCGCGQPRSTG